jgi:hypothetical protein
MDFMELVENLGTVANTVGDVVGTINKFKGLAQSGKADATAFAAPAAGVRAMAQFQPMMPDPYGGGGQWLGQLQGWPRSTATRGCRPGRQVSWAST